MNDATIVEGVIVDVCRGLHAVDVTIPGPRGTTRSMRVLCRRAGKLDQAHIKCLVGDVVTVEICPYDTSRGRIVYRGVRRAA